MTPRECEVLHWLARGKRDTEIGLIIDASSATVSKHIERILRRLNAASRGAAVAEAREMRNQF